MDNRDGRRELIESQHRNGIRKEKNQKIKLAKKKKKLSCLKKYLRDRRVNKWTENQEKET